MKDQDHTSVVNSQEDVTADHVSSLHTVNHVSSQEDHMAGQLSEEERIELEQENQMMYMNLNSVADEVKQIEGKVVKISQLVDVFSEKLLQQSEVIDNIADMAVETTGNVKMGNEEVRQAIKNRASFRAWILFILIACSFSLLFLDWYS